MSGIRLLLSLSHIGLLDDYMNFSESKNNLVLDTDIKSHCSVQPMEVACSLICFSNPPINFHLFMVRGTIEWKVLGHYLLDTLVNIY